MKHRIAVLGAGYAGASAAGRLARRLSPEDTEITLVNAEPDFIERVRMHQLACGQALKPRPLDEMFEGTGVRLRIDRVLGADVESRRVDLAGGEALEYDTLVFGLGSGTADHGIPGFAEHAHEIASRPGALRLREHLQNLAEGETVAVVGAGLTGLEFATELAETRPDLKVAILSRGRFGDWLSHQGRRHLRRVCSRLRIDVHEHADVESLGHGEAATADGRTFAAAAIVWTTGFAVNPLTATSGLALASSGQIVVDRTMRSVSHPEVYAVGDTAFAIGPEGRPLRMSCASGTPVAWQAADAIAARLSGNRVPKVPVRYFNQCISLGRRDGLIQFVTADDRSKRTVVKGRAAARYKELVCRGAAWGVANPTIGMPVRRRHLAASARSRSAPAAS